MGRVQGLKTLYSVQSKVVRSDAALRRASSAAAGNPALLFDHRMVAYAHVVAPSQADALAVRVNELGRHWIVRSRTGGSFTLGVSARLDAAKTPRRAAIYYERLAEHNVRMRTHFGGLLEQIKRAIGGIVGRDVAFSKTLALPGFRILNGQAIAAASQLGPMRNLQHVNLNWHVKPSQQDTFSFILPIRVPSAGGGIAIWSRPARNPVPSVFPFVPGVLLLQHGASLHRPARIPGLRQNDSLVTLEGHGIRIGPGYVLYG